MASSARSRRITGFRLAAAAAICMPCLYSTSLAAQQVTPVAAPATPYSDLADLADSAQLVLKAQVRKLTRVENERARGLRAGWGRFYVQAKTRALLIGQAPQGEALTYLVDLPLDAKGKPPAVKKKDVLLFARPVRGRVGELQLVAPDAQILWNPQIETRLRGILTELVSPDAPDRVTGVREIIYVPGNLAGEGETQIFLSTEKGSAASITVQTRPNAQPIWGVSFSELIAELGNPPQRDSLTWYRLACFLPASPPPAANLSETAEGRARADADYRLVLNQLGPCGRSRR